MRGMREGVDELRQLSRGYTAEAMRAPPAPAMDPMAEAPMGGEDPMAVGESCPHCGQPMVASGAPVPEAVLNDTSDAPSELAAMGESEMPAAAGMDGGVDNEASEMGAPEAAEGEMALSPEDEDALMKMG